MRHTYQNIVPVGSKVLEIGCLDGKFLHSLKPLLGVGIDFSAIAIASGRAAYPEIEFIHMDAHEIDLGARKFDFIIISELFNDASLEMGQ